MFKMMTKALILLTTLLYSLTSMAISPITATYQSNSSTTIFPTGYSTGKANYLVSVNPLVKPTNAALKMSVSNLPSWASVTGGASQCTQTTAVCGTSFSLRAGQSCCLMLTLDGINLGVGNYDLTPYIGTTPSAYSFYAPSVKIMITDVFVTTAPVSVAVNPGSRATFSTVTAGGVTPYAYQWELSTDGGASFVTITGETSASYTTLPTDVGDNGNQYRVKVTDLLDETIITSAAVLAVNGALTTTTPSSVTLDVSQQATFSTTASDGITPYHYQWEISTDGGVSFAAINQATSASYTTPSVSLGDNANQYRVIVTDSALLVPQSVTSGVAILTVNGALTVSAPVSATVDAGEVATFSTTASGGTPGPDGYSYQWQISTNGGSLFSAISGATSASYTTPAATLSNNGNQYRVVVTDHAPHPQVVTSKVAILTVNGALTTTTPKSEALDAGESATLSTTASGGTTPYTYQWQISTNSGVSFAAISGATSSSYITPPVTISHNGDQYRVVVTDSIGAIVTSGVAVLTVEGALTATSPLSVILDTGETATFSTTASSGTRPYSYQWQRSTDGGSSFSAISGATLASYTTPAVSQSENGYQYRVIVTDSATPKATVTTAAATLTVNGALTATNPVSVVTDVTTPSVTFSTTVSGGTTGMGYGYQWQVSTDGVSFSAISGATLSTYTVQPISLTENGYQYRVMVTDNATPKATVTTAAATLTVNGALTATNPVNMVADVTTPSVTFSTTASGGTKGGGYGYQWQVSTDGVSFSAISGATLSTYTVQPISLTENGYQYRVMVTDNATPKATVTTAAATLTVNGALTATNPVSVVLDEGGTATFSTTASGGTRSYTYQWQLSTNSGTSFANIATATSASYTTPTVVLSNNGYQYRVVVTDHIGSMVTTSAATLTVNHALTATNPVSVVTDATTGSAVFSTTASGGTGSDSYQWEISTNGGTSFAAISGANLSTYTVPTPIAVSENGYQYRVVVMDSATPKAVVTTSAATLAVNGALTATNPVSVVTDASTGSAIFSTTVSGGTGSDSYQWEISTNGGTSFAAISGANLSTYTVPTPIAVSENGYQYRVVVMDSATPQAVVTTSAATLTVNGALTATNPVSVVVDEGGTATFSTIASGGTGSDSYQWQVSTNAGGSFANIATATSASYTTPTVALSNNGYQYRVVVTDHIGSLVTTSAATLTVNNALTATNPVNVVTDATTGSAVFSTTASGGTPAYTYQWQLSTNGGTSFAAISGATSSMYTVPTPIAVSENGYQYRVMVTDSATSKAVVTTLAATLTVNGALTASNPVSVVTDAITGSAVFSTTVSGGTGNDTYQWQLSTNGGASFAAISGATSSTYTVSPVAQSENSYQYRVVVMDSATPKAVVTTSAATLTVNGALTATNPVNVVVDEGGTALFSTTVSGGTLNYIYEWQLSTNGGTSFSTLSGTDSSSYTVSPVTLGNNGYQYRVVVKDPTGATVTTSAATLTVNGALMATNPVNVVTDATTGSAVFSTTASGGTPAYTYQWQLSINGGVSFSAISGATLSTYTAPTPIVLSNNGYQYRVVVTDQTTATITTSAATLTVNGALAATNPVSVVADVNQTATFSTTASGGTGSYTYQWQLSTDGGVTFNSIGTNLPSYTTPSVTSNYNGYQYRVVVNDGITMVTTLVATLTVNGVLTATNPVNQVANVGQTVTFSTTASGGTPGYTYQWQSSPDGTTFTNIPSAMARIYSFTFAAPNNHYQYRVQVTDNALVTVTTSAATLTAAPPTITTFSPSSGSYLGGTPVIISGTGFTNTTSVTFGTATATAINIVSDSSLSVTSPAGTVPVNITVTAIGGSVTSAGKFTYTVPITASAGANGSISPSGTTFVPYNGSLQLSATAAANYLIDTWNINSGGSTQTGGATYTFSNVTSSQTAAVSFAVNSNFYTVPGAPLRFIATPGDNSVTLNWTAPATPVSQPITKYTVLYGPSSATTAPSTAGCTTTGATTCSISGLNNGTAYTFSITAANNIGVGPASYSSATMPMDDYTVLSVSPVTLAVSGLGNGQSRTITFTNTTASLVTITSVTAPYPSLPAPAVVVGVTASNPNPCVNGATLAASGGTCTIMINPGNIATSTDHCTIGAQPSPSVITVSTATGTFSANIYVLGYGCNYQGGYLFSIDDTTPITGSIGGVVAAVDYQSTSSVWGGFSPYVSIWGIDDQSTSVTPSPSSTIPVGYTAQLLQGQLNCNGVNDGSCDTNNVTIYYPSTSYAANICRQPIDSEGNSPCSTGNCYVDWYLPSACQLMNSSSFTSPPCSTNGSIYNQLYLNSIGGFTGLNWSATEYSNNPLQTVNLWDVPAAAIVTTSKDGGSYNTRCTRGLTF